LSGTVAPSSDVAVSRLPIVAIETIPIRVPLARVYRGSHYQMTHRSTLIVRVHTEPGIVGEAYAGDEDGALHVLRRIVADELAPKLIGEDALAIERCWEIERAATYDILRDRRLGLVAGACLDTAIWDAVGKAYRQPLWRLWGGYRNTLPIIAIGGYYAPDADLHDEVAELLELGVGGMKLKVGGRTPEQDVERFRHVREAGGPNFRIAADANQGWSPQEAMRFARGVADLDLLWFEEPCRWHNDRLAMRDVRLTSGVRVCAGQSEYSAGGCRDLMTAGAIDVCNFDASWSGGPTEWRRVAAMATCFDVAMGHHEEPQVASHLLSSIPHGTCVECFHPDRDPIWWNLIANRPKLRDGMLELGETPGLGWELDEDYIAHHRVPDAP
jgi:L-alanine-DL-glutamate epimerase-like enolase superfamily enzyme